MARYRYHRYYRRATAFVPNAPSRGVWLLAIFIGGLGVLARLVPIGELSVYNYWMLLIGFLLLLLGTTARGI